MKYLSTERLLQVRATLREDWRRVVRLQLELRPYLQGVPYWVAAVLVGIIAFFYSEAFTYCIEFARKIHSHPYLLFVTSPICFVLATWVVQRFSPPAGGTGIPQILRALELNPVTQEKQIDYLLNLKTVIVIAISSLLCMMGAGALGREGPMVQMAACIFYVVGRQCSRIWPSGEQRSWVVAGGAAGIAAAFNAPLAGVVFVLEELAQQHFHRFKTVVISAAIIAGIVSQWLSGRYLYFGYPKIGDVPISSVLWAVWVGIVCGLIALPFHKILALDVPTKCARYFKTRLGFAFFMGLCIAALATFVNPDIIGGGVSVISHLIFSPGQTASWSLIIGRFAATMLSHLSGCAGGFLAPSLALGAAVGSKMAVLGSYPNHNLLVLVGMSALLSAIIRAPFTAWVIVMEMTDRHAAIFPLMVASLISYTVVHVAFDKQISHSSSL